jgi:hypothetical protein
MIIPVGPKRPDSSFLVSNLSGYQIVRLRDHGITDQAVLKRWLGGITCVTLAPKRIYVQA